MCLDTIKEEYESPSMVVVSAAKTFRGSSAKPIFENYGVQENIKSNSFEVPLDQWITAEEKEIAAGSGGKKYKTGFHVYESDQKVSGERRVYVRQITYRGTQESKVVLIARQMYVPSNQNGWPPKVNEEKSMLEKIKDKIVGQGGNA